MEDSVSIKVFCLISFGKISDKIQITRFYGVMYGQFL